MSIPFETTERISERKHLSLAKMQGHKEGKGLFYCPFGRCSNIYEKKLTQEESHVEG
jgi:hypothetical protein